MVAKGHYAGRVGKERDYCKNNQGRKSSVSYRVSSGEKVTGGTYEEYLHTGVYVDCMEVKGF